MEASPNLNFPSPTATMQPPESRGPLGRPTSKRKIVIICTVLVFTILLLITAAVLLPRKSDAPAPAQKPTVTKKTAPKKTSIRFIASGDVIAHDALNAQAKLPDGSYDYYQFMKPMQPYFTQADVRFCNQAVPGGGVEFGIRGYPIFNSPLEVAAGMNKLGCNVVNTGTNHTFDLGQAVINAQQNYWDTLPKMLAVAGANRTAEEQQKVRYFGIEKVKFAFVSYSTYSNITPPNTFGLNMFSEALAKPQITEARQNADIVLVSMRWGTEYSSAINAQQDIIAQQLSDWGADVILGHGPHVLQPVKQLTAASGRKTLAWYSLGNFLNAQLETEALISGLAVMDIDIKTKAIKPPAFMPLYMHYEWTADEKARQDLMKRTAFTMLPLDTSAELLARSQLATTVPEQTQRITQLLNQFAPVKIVSSKAYLQ